MASLQLSPKLTLFRDEFGVLTNVSPQIPDNTEPHHMHHFVPQAQRFVNAVRVGGPSPIDPHKVLLSQVIMDGTARSRCRCRSYSRAQSAERFGLVMP